MQNCVQSCDEENSTVMSSTTLHGLLLPPLPAVSVELLLSDDPLLPPLPSMSALHPRIRTLFDLETDWTFTAVLVTVPFQPPATGAGRGGEERRGRRLHSKSR